MNYTGNLQNERGSKLQSDHGNKDGQKHRSKKGKLASPLKAETQYSDADENRGGAPMMEYKEQEKDGVNLPRIKRNYWNSITFDYDDFLGGITPA